MIKRLVLAIIALIMIVTGSAMLAHGQNIDIEITTENDAINVIETYSIDAIEGDTIAFWIQSGPSDVAITINGSATTISLSNNIYYVNISEFEITSKSVIEVKYSLEKNKYEFEKNLLYNTTSFTIKYDGNELYSGNNLISGSSLNISLKKQTQGENNIVETIPLWIYILIIVLVILLIASFTMSTKKRKSTTKKEGIGGSEELLVTKKSLLMETLKEIEKRHRDKQISDDTYHKLKDVFKQDAVEAMRQLEDLKK